MTSLEQFYRGKKILVTGGGGFLGKAVAKRLVQLGAHVTSFSRGSYPELVLLKVDSIQGDLVNEEDVAKACSNRDMIFHVAAKPGIAGKYEEYYLANTVGTENILKAVKKYSIPLVYTSSPSVIFDGKDMEGVNEDVPYPQEYHAHYPKTKALAEQMVIKAADEGGQTIILRPHLIWGPEDNHLIPRIIKKAEKLWRIGSENKLIDTVYIDNAAEAHVLAGLHLSENPSLSGKTYFISQGDPIPLWDFINKILLMVGKKPVNRIMPVKVASSLGSIIEKSFSLLSIKTEPPMTPFLAQELSTAHWFDISAAKSDLGYQPHISIDEGFDRVEQWLKGDN